MLLVLALLVAPAQASTTEVLLGLELVHAFGRPHPWGVRLGADLLWALGNQCGGGLVLYERDCRSTEGFFDPPWPELGPGLAVDWRGGERLGAQLHGAVGLGALDVWDVGFMPYWELLGMAGLRAEVGEGVSVVLGGRGTVRVVPGFSLRADLVVPWTGAGWQPLVLAAGPQLCTYASTDY